MLKIIAEVGSVHDGSFGNALCLIEAVAKAGAWAIKFQHHIAEEETTDYAPNPTYFKGESRKIILIGYHSLKRVGTALQ